VAKVKQVPARRRKSVMENSSRGSKYLRKLAFQSSLAGSAAANIASILK
jgi:hypothetical protein